MESNTLFSIIIPTYNSSEYILRCVDSIKKQKSVPTYEIIIVDNGSTDNTLDLIKEIGISEIVLAPEVSVYKARNQAVSKAKGEVLAFIDSDCVADPYWLHNAAVLMGKAQLIAGNIQPLLSNQKSLYYYDKFFKRKAITGRPIHTSGGNMFADRKLFHKLGGFIEDFNTAGDSLFSMEARLQGYEVAYGENVIVLHPVDTFTKRIRGEFREGRGSLIKKHYLLRQDIGFDDKNGKLIFNKFENLLKQFQHDISGIKYLWKEEDLKIRYFLETIFIVLFFRFLTYFAVVVNNNFPWLASKLARR